MDFINHVKDLILSSGSFFLQTISYCMGDRKLLNESCVTRIGFSSKSQRDTSYCLNYLSNLWKPGVVKWNLVIAFLGRYAISKVGKWDQPHKHWDSVVRPFQHLPPPSSSSIFFQSLNNHLPQVVSYHRFQRDGGPSSVMAPDQGVPEGADCKCLEDHCDRSLQPPQGCLGKTDSFCTFVANSVAP